MSDTTITPGTLKVFLGMCPGVGKTYAMLEAARALKGRGAEVVAGVVETHGRKETAGLLEGLETLPLAEVDHRGTTLREFDLEAMLARRPQHALIDELAHTNAPGSRHPKRWQDVAELLDAGIHVLTTLNIQHLETRADVVGAITGTVIRETVPDSFLERASEIELIDITPRDLRERLEAGKVYLEERAQAASANFFKESNLTALRQLALRYTAERVGVDLQELQSRRRDKKTWRSEEKILVAVGASPYSPALIRRARAMAGTLDARWSAIAVSTGEPMPPAEREAISNHLALARQLGAEAATVEAISLVDGLLEAARERNATQIVIGKSPGHSWKDFFLRPPALRLLRRSGSIDIIAVEPAADAAAVAPVSQPSRLNWGRELATATVITALTVGAGLVAAELLGEQGVALLMLCGVIVGGLFLRAAGTWFLAILTGLAWNYFLTEPLYTLSIRSGSDVALFAALIVAALSLGHLTSRLRRRERSVSQQRLQYSRLLEVSNILTTAHDTHEMIARFSETIGRLFGLRCAVRLRAVRNHELEAPHPAGTLPLDAKEQGVSNWAFSNKRAAGKGTDTQTESSALHLPLQGRSLVMGVLSISSGDEPLTLGDRDQLAAIAAQLGIALERDHLLHAVHHAEFIERGDQLRRSLLDHVSHELRTPAAILGTSIDALGQGTPVETLLPEMHAARTRLQRVVEQLVQSARIESGALSPSAEWCDLLDLLETARDRASESLGPRQVILTIHSGTPPLVWIDAELFLTILENLLANIGHHTPAGTRAELTATADGDATLEIQVTDDGPGLDNPAAVFDRFHRGDDSHHGGLGLGLSIVRGIARGLGGEIRAENRDGGGTRFFLRLPVKTAVEIPQT